MYRKCRECDYETGDINIKNGLCQKCREKVNSNTLSPPKPIQEIISYAYISFKILGYIFLVASITFILDQFDTIDPGVIGFFLVLPLTILSIPMIILVAIFLLFIWHDSHINAMRLFTVFLVPMLILINNTFPPIWLPPLLFAFYGTACINIGSERFSNFLKSIGLFSNQSRNN